MAERMGHWPDLHQPPAAVPMAEIMVVVNRIRGIETDNVRAAYAGTVVLGYGICTLPHEERIGDAPPMSEEDVCKMLETADRMQGVIPWASLLAVIGPLVLEWLKNRR